MPDWIAVDCVSPPGRGQRLSEPAVSDLTICASAIAEALSAEPDVPIALFGHSVGALVAFEVARQLEARGAVPVVRLFVSALPAPARATRDHSFAGKDDATLLADLDALGLLPSEIVASDDLRRMVLGAVRTDFSMCARAKVPEQATVHAPILALGGLNDPHADRDALLGWQAHAQKAFDVRVFDGGHFYTQTSQKDLLQFLTTTLQTDLAALSASIEHGEAATYPIDVSLADHFRAAAQQHPSQPALIGVDRTLTFRALDAETDLLAQHLRAMGLKRDQTAAILLETSADFAMACLAAMKAGGAYLPIPLATPDGAIASILDSLQPAAVITRPAYCGRLPADWQSRSRTVLLQPNWQEGLARAQASPNAMWPLPSDISGDDLAYCVMTSGTTGQPKAIACPHRGAVNSYWWRYRHLPYTDDEREACNVFFVWEVLRPLLRGKPAYVIPDDVIFDPRKLITFLADHSITRVLLTPSLFEHVLNALDRANAPEPQLAALRTIILNGEVVTGSLLARARNLLPHVAIINDYSISECHDVATTALRDLDTNTAPRFMPAGRVMDNVRVYILDEDRKPVTRGATGEVYVAGPTLARGYLGLPEETALRFVTDPFQGGDARMFRTGDAGRFRADGQLEITGRTAFMVKLRGYTVVPTAIETALCAHAAITAAAVVTIDDPDTGQPDRLVGYVTGRDGAPDNDTMADVRAMLAETLPAYAIPSQLIGLAGLPLHPTTGKIDRARLPAADLRSPEQAGVRGDVATCGPQSPVDLTDRAFIARIRDIWDQVLPQPAQTDNDNFFDLGGHSLLAITLAARVEAAFDIRLDVIDVFHHPILVRFAEHISKQLAQQAPQRMAGAPQRHANWDALSIKRKRSRRVANSDPHAQADDIAVIGLACRFPGADTPEDLWRNLVSGVDAVRDLSDRDIEKAQIPEAVRHHRDFVRAAALIGDVASFDAAFFGISAREALVMDPQQRLFLECCWHAMERAGHAPGSRAAKVGVYAGCYLPGYLVHELGAQRHLDPFHPTAFHLAEIGNDKDYLAARVAYLLDLDGPAISVQTSCSTGLVAIAQAADAIRAGSCDMALAGAASLIFPRAGAMHIDGHVISRQGRSRTFDAKADGTILGDGVGVVVLRRLADARDDGDDILAVLKGWAVNNDGAARASFSAPGVAGQAAVISDALSRADVHPDTIGYVEAHGTATRIGDPIEVRALTSAWQSAGASADGARTCSKDRALLGSIKANIGHANIAAGVAGFIKCVLALRHQVIPPQIHFDVPNPALRLEETPFRIATTRETFPLRGDAPARAAVSSFGIGGTNAHAILQAAPTAIAPDTEPRFSEVIPLSARSQAQVGTLARALSRTLDHDAEATQNRDLADIAGTLQSGRKALGHRIAVVATDMAAAARRLSDAADRTAASTPPGATPAPAQKLGGIAFVFAGQGAQHARMACGLAEAAPAFASHFSDAAAAFAGRVPDDLSKLRDPETADDVLATAVGLQPALLCVDYAIARTLMDWGIQPTIAAGHSLGQYAAAAALGLLQLDDAAALVSARARAMDQCKVGRMLSLTADADTARALIGGLADTAIAAMNALDETVVAGPADAIEQIAARARAAGISHQAVAVTRAFHSPMMDEAAKTIADVALKCAPGTSSQVCPILCNVTGGVLMPDQARNAAYWAQHAREPVRFMDNAAAILAAQPALILEIGPGMTLTRLCRKAAAGRDAEAMPRFATTLCHARDRDGQNWDVLSAAVAAAWETGCDINWRAFRAGRPAHRKTALPVMPFARTRHWPDPARDQPRGSSIDTFLGTPDPERGTGNSKTPHVLPWTDRFWVADSQRVTWPSCPDNAVQNWLVISTQMGPQDVDKSNQPFGRLTDAVCDRMGNCSSTLVRLRHDLRDGPAALARVISRRMLTSPDLRLLLAIAPPSSGETLKNPADRLLPIAQLAKALAMRTPRKPIGLTVLSSGVGMAGLDAEADAFGHMLAGAVLAVGQEDPTVSVKLIDVADARVGSGASMHLNRVVEAIQASPAQTAPLLALHARGAFVERFSPLRLGETQRTRGRARLERGPHIIFGGTGRIGRHLARHLCGLGADVFVASRRRLPAETDWATILAEPSAHDAGLVEILQDLDACRTMPGSLHTLACDITEPGAVADCLGAVAASYGRIGGVFQAAGLARIEELADTTAETITAELAPKVAGTQALATALATCRQSRGVTPDFVLVFSSLAATLGGIGLGAYAAANRFQDAWVRAIVGTGNAYHCDWRAIAWDDWQFDYGDAQVAAYARTRAEVSLPPDEAVAALEAVLGEPGLDHVLVSATHFPERRAQWTSSATNGADGRDQCMPPGQPAMASAHAPCANEPPSPITLADAEARDSGVARAVLAAYTEVLGVAHIAPDDDFFALGGDSLFATEIVRALALSLPGCPKIRITDVFDHASVRELAAHVTSVMAQEGSESR